MQGVSDALRSWVSDATPDLSTMVPPPVADGSALALLAGGALKTECLLELHERNWLQCLKNRSERLTRRGTSLRIPLYHWSRLVNFLSRVTWPLESACFTSSMTRAQPHSHPDPAHTWSRTPFCYQEGDPRMFRRTGHRESVPVGFVELY